MAMADVSRAVTQNGEDRLRSALIKAFDAWTEPYDIRPDGVFGSVATVQCGDVTISSEQLDLEFTVPFDDDIVPNEADVTVYNLSDNTIKQLKKGAALSISAGYKDDTGVLFSGFVTKVMTIRDGSDRVTTIYAMDDIKEHTVESLAFAAGTKASEILRALIDKTGIPVAVFNPRRDHTYKDAQTVDGELMKNIKDYAEVCGISVYVSRGKIYARYIKEGDNLNFSLSSATGLIGSPSPFTEEIQAEDFLDVVDGYEAEMLLQHRMCAGAIVSLNCKSAKGEYRVCSGKHVFSPDEAVTKVKMF